MQTERPSQGDNSIGQLIAHRRPNWSLEQAFYTDPAVYQAEMQHIFGRYWLYAGHISQIPRAGDYLTYTIGDDSVLVTRGEEGRVHAMFNVCRHRGSVVCTEPTGHVKRLVCPYHQWTYDLDGTLLAAKHMGQDFDRMQFPLHPVQVRVLEGFIFVSLSANPPDFEPIARQIGIQMRPHSLEQAKIVYRLRFELPANWKLALENWHECYHCAVGHPEFCRITGADRMFASAQGRQEYETYAAARQAAWETQGIVSPRIPLESPYTYYCCQRYALKQGCLTESLDGQLVAPLMGTVSDADMGILGVNIFPIFSIQINSDYAMTLNMKPLGPQLTDYEVTWLVRADAVEGVDYQLEPLIAFWRITAEQDVSLIRNNQRGIRSQHYQPGPLSEIEKEVMERFLRWYLDQLPSEEVS